jgi:hypothetical protein
MWIELSIVLHRDKCAVRALILDAEPLDIAHGWHTEQALVLTVEVGRAMLEVDEQDNSATWGPHVTDDEYIQ